MHTLNDGARDGSHGHGQPFLETNTLLLMCPVNLQNDEKHTLNDGARDGSHGHGQPFLETNALLLMCPVYSQMRRSFAY